MKATVHTFFQVPAETETPEWGSLSQPEDSQAREEEIGEKSPETAPKTWRGVGEFQVRLPME